MTPAELRRMAEMVLGWHETCGGCGNPYRGTSHNVNDDTIAIAQHVLDTVREDDDVPLGFNYVVTHPSITQSCMKYSYGTITIRGMELELHSYDLGGEPCYLIGRDGLRLETRGQLRRLLEGLGVTAHEK